MRQPDAKKHFQTLKGENPGGKSYEELSVGSNFRKEMLPRYALDGATEDIRSEAQNAKSAGAPSIRPMKGSGHFQYETEWRIEMAPDDSFSTRTTETRANFKSPPSDFKKVVTRIQPNVSQLESLGVDQGDYRTTKAISYDPGLLKNAERQHAIVPEQHRNLLKGFNKSGADVEENFTSTTKLHHSTDVLSTKDGMNDKACGNINTRPCGYNIITGGQPLYNNNFEQYQPGREYCRKRT